MITAPLRSFATSARTELLREVNARLIAVLAQSAPERVEQSGAVAALERAIAGSGGGETGAAHIADRVAYTWFNRIVALRFMDANGYTGVGIVSPAAGHVGQPDVLAAAKRGQIDGAVVSGISSEIVTGLLNGTRRPRPGTDAQAEAYALLLAEYCRWWNRAMPFMFERDGDYTELLIPANLLAEDSVLSRSVKVLTEEVCQDVEVIGWLYQFYISERKDEVFAGFKKNKKAGADEIPAATQLFTPHWIVRYLIENSLGRLWMLNRPDSRLVEQMKYYIAPVDDEPDFLRISGPEELTVIDPACGSGHMLTYAFDLLYAIYEEEGYAPSQIPGLILTHNLYGTEIDPRAGALAAFALSMKAAARRKLFLKNPVEPNVCVLDPVSFNGDELRYLTTEDGDRRGEEEFWNQFRHADTFGSLIRPNSALIPRLAQHLVTLDDEGDLLRADALSWAQRVLDQASYLARHYSVVVANPPYMGSKQMNALLSQFMKEEYPTGKSDLFAAFIERCTDFAGPQGAAALITMQSWMFLSSYEKLRLILHVEQRLTSMLHLGPRAFDSIGGEVVSATAFVLTKLPPGGRDSARQRAGTFLRLVDGATESGKVALLTAALEARTQEAGFHLASDADFAAIPGSPIVYWLSEKMRAAFQLGARLGDIAEVRQGLATADNHRFLRQWWEVAMDRSAMGCRSTNDASTTLKRWFPYNKGGDFRRWYGNHEYVVNWENDGAEIRVFGAEGGGRPRSRAQNTSAYFSPSVSWSDISSGAPSFRQFPVGFIHGNKGNSIFGGQALLDRLLGVLNAPCSTSILEALTPTMTASVGDVAKTPIPLALGELPTEGITALVSTAAADWNESESSWNYSKNPLITRAR